MESASAPVTLVSASARAARIGWRSFETYIWNDTKRMAQMPSANPSVWLRMYRITMAPTTNKNVGKNCRTMASNITSNARANLLTRCVREPAKCDIKKLYECRIRYSNAVENRSLITCASTYWLLNS